MEDATPVPPALSPGDAVIAVMTREQLSAALVATHRAGFGPNARVFDPARGDIDGQLARAGLPIHLAQSDKEPTVALIVVMAPGRADRVEATLRDHGARSIYRVARGAGGEARVSTLRQDSIVETDAANGGAVDTPAG